MTQQPDLQSPTPQSPPMAPPPFQPRRHPYTWMAVSLAVLAAGLAGLTWFAHSATRAVEGSPWAEAIIVLVDEAPWEGMAELWARERTNTEPPGSSPLWDQVVSELEKNEDGRLALEQLGVNKGERMIAIDLPAAAFEPVLVDGRLPKPGKPEVLAGDLARTDPFELDGIDYQVVGRLNRNASGFLFTYVLPYDAAFDDSFRDSDEAAHGWFDPEGMEKLAALEPEDLPEDAKIVGAMARLPVAMSYGVLAALALVIAGSSGFQILVFRQWASTHIVGLDTLLREMIARPYLFIGLHVAFFGLFLGMGIVGISQPVMNMHVMNLIRDIFVEGDLKYVGDAYASGNVFSAALATFNNNYIWQTLTLTLAASVAIPFFGLLKNAASFAFAGFGMAPLWASTLGLLPFHSITIAVELEAYVVACFAVTVWPLLILKAVMRRDPRHAIRAVMVMSGAVLLTGLMLAAAGLYEAGTLIILK